MCIFTLTFLLFYRKPPTIYTSKTEETNKNANQNLVNPYL